MKVRSSRKDRTAFENIDSMIEIDIGDKTDAEKMLKQLIAEQAKGVLELFVETLQVEIMNGKIWLYSSDFEVEGEISIKDILEKTEEEYFGDIEDAASMMLEFIEKKWSKK